MTIKRLKFWYNNDNLKAFSGVNGDVIEFVLLHYIHNTIH